MRVLLSTQLSAQIEAHLEEAYPNEGAGFLLGAVDHDAVKVERVLPLSNQREQEAQHNRYELSPLDFARAEEVADASGLALVGVFHSHPDHPAQPSTFDRDHAWPHFSYLITSVQNGKAVLTRAWRLREDRSTFDEDEFLLGEI
ncbi:MAG: M67 family metallopeptidase [Chloroflexi bacterium]|nr:M67 family metallopeptidase [Chloroflexota bacterium]